MEPQTKDLRASAVDGVSHQSSVETGLGEDTRNRVIMYVAKGFLLFSTAPLWPTQAALCEQVVRECAGSPGRYICIIYHRRCSWFCRCSALLKLQTLARARRSVQIVRLRDCDGPAILLLWTMVCDILCVRWRLVCCGLSNRCGSVCVSASQIVNMGSCGGQAAHCSGCKCLQVLLTILMATERFLCYMKYVK